MVASARIAQWIRGDQLRALARNRDSMRDVVALTKTDISNLTGNYRTDEALANKKVGLSETPEGYVWHHVENGLTMLLIPQDLHNAVCHTGGSAVLQPPGD